MFSLLLIEHEVFPVTNKRERLSADRERLLGSEICPHIVGHICGHLVIDAATTSTPDGVGERHLRPLDIVLRSRTNIRRVNNTLII